MLQIKNEYSSYTSKTFRIPSEIISRLEEEAVSHNTSLNKVVIQCLEYAIQSLNNPAATVHNTVNNTPNRTSNRTPGITPNSTPDSTPRSTPNSTTDSTPDSTTNNSVSNTGTPRAAQRPSQGSRLPAALL